MEVIMPAPMVDTCTTFSSVFSPIHEESLHVSTIGVGITRANVGQSWWRVSSDLNTTSHAVCSNDELALDLEDGENKMIP